jgi:hypothetical protein
LIGDFAVPQFFILQALVIPLLILSTVLHHYTIQGRTPETARWIGWSFRQSAAMAAAFLGVKLVGSSPDRLSPS